MVDSAPLHLAHHVEPIPPLDPRCYAHRRRRRAHDAIVTNDSRQLACSPQQSPPAAPRARQHAHGGLHGSNAQGQDAAPHAQLVQRRGQDHDCEDQNTCAQGCPRVSREPIWRALGSWDVWGVLEENGAVWRGWGGRGRAGYVEIQTAGVSGYAGGRERLHACAHV